MTTVCCNTTSGVALWTDGLRPTIAFGRDLESLRQTTTGQPDERSGSGEIPEDGPAWFIDADVAKPVPALNGSHFVGEGTVRFTLRATRIDERWDALRAWVLAAEELSKSGVVPVFGLVGAMEHIPDEFLAFCERRIGTLTIHVADHGIDPTKSGRAMECASRLADLGLPVRAVLSLTHNSMNRWADRASSWRTITRNQGLDFAHPCMNERGSLESRPPRNEALVEFLLDIYERRQHDLWRTAPFSRLLHAMTLGTRAIPQCGSHAVIGTDGGRLFGHCRFIRESCTPSKVPKCTCNLGALCDAVCAPCGGSPPHSRHAYCSLLQAVVPRVLDELSRAAVLQHTLTRRNEDRRFRIAARNGKPVVWTETVTTDHRNRFEGANHADPHDLSWVRPRPAGSVGHGQPSGAPAPAP